MPATVNIVSAHGTTGATSNVDGSSIRFKLADNDTVDSNNPVPIPAAGTNYSYVKQLRFSCGGGLSGTLNNLRFYTSGSFGTGVGLRARSKDVWGAPGSDKLAASTGNTSLILQGAGTPGWTTDEWAGYVVQIVAGTSSGDYRRITTNTSSALTVSSAFSSTPDNTTQYRIAYFEPVNNAATQVSGTADAFTYTSGSPLSFTGSTTTTGAFGNFVTLQLSVGSTASPGATSSVTLTFVYDET